MIIIIIIYNVTLTSCLYIPIYRVNWKNVKRSLFKNIILDFQIKMRSRGRPWNLPPQTLYKMGKTKNSQNFFNNITGNSHKKQMSTS